MVTGLLLHVLFIARRVHEVRCSHWHSLQASPCTGTKASMDSISDRCSSYTTVCANFQYWPSSNMLSEASVKANRQWRISTNAAQIVKSTGGNACTLRSVVSTGTNLSRACRLVMAAVRTWKRSATSR
ncbi:hypothetical protein V8C44DRAFT_342655 [Trichoderma aethiopicum]